MARTQGDLQGRQPAVRVDVERRDLCVWICDTRRAGARELHSYRGAHTRSNTRWVLIPESRGFPGRVSGAITSDRRRRVLSVARRCGARRRSAVQHQAPRVRGLPQLRPRAGRHGPAKLRRPSSVHTYVALGYWGDPEVLRVEAAGGVRFGMWSAPRSLVIAASTKSTIAAA